MISAFGIEHGDISKGLPSALKHAKLVPVTRYAKDRVAANAMGKDAASFISAGKKTKEPIFHMGAFTAMREGQISRNASRGALK